MAPEDSAGAVGVQGGKVDAGFRSLGDRTEPVVTVQVGGGVTGVGRVDL